jgi:hypothetical protein
MEENIFIRDSSHIGYCSFNQNTKEFYYAITILIHYKNTKSPKTSGGFLTQFFNLQS